MKCERLQVLIRDWYHQVRNETLSPLKMMELIKKHIENCSVCQMDGDLPFELEELREIIRVPYDIEQIKKEEETFFTEDIDFVFKEDEL